MNIIDFVTLGRVTLLDKVSSRKKGRLSISYLAMSCLHSSRARGHGTAERHSRVTVNC